MKPRNDENTSKYVWYGPSPGFVSIWDQNRFLARDLTSNLLRNGHLTSTQNDEKSIIRALEWPQTPEVRRFKHEIFIFLFISGLYFVQNQPETHNWRDIKQKLGSAPNCGNYFFLINHKKDRIQSSFWVRRRTIRIIKAGDMHYSANYLKNHLFSIFVKEKWALKWKGTVLCSRDSTIIIWLKSSAFTFFPCS